jgi:hypothetical protein
MTFIYIYYLFILFLRHTHLEDQLQTTIKNDADTR